MGFYAAADGTLSPMPGSPFPSPGRYWLSMAATGCVLFGVDGFNIDSFRVNSDGSLSLSKSAVAGQGTAADPSLQAVNLYLDPTNSNLYVFDYSVPDGLGSMFASYTFDSSTGQVTQVGSDVIGGDGTLAIASNDRYAVATYCNLRGGIYITEYQRGGDGALNLMGYGPYPASASGLPWCPGNTAADGSGHFVIELSPWNPEGPFVNPEPPVQLAIYSIDDSGNLTTASTSQNMIVPQYAPAAYQFSPDGRYLASAGGAGLQVFTWDSAHLTLNSIATIPSGATCGSGGGCTGPRFGNISWDEYDHLYTTLGQQLIVYAVTPSGVAPVPDSPHGVKNPQWVTVLPEKVQ